jgi:SAM-dependent methyltransferase
MSDREVPVSDRSRFEAAYAGNAPWDIGRPQSAIVNHAASLTGKILDAGCGTGEHALYFASKGHQVTGIDYLTIPISQAGNKASRRNLDVTFVVMDALALRGLHEVFDSILDSGLFHVFNDQDRQRYVSGLASVLKPGGKLLLLCFSDQEPGDHGPRRISRQELEQTFSGKWEIELIEETRFEIRPDFQEVSFSPGGPLAYLMIARRT